MLLRPTGTGQSSSPVFSRGQYQGSRTALTASDLVCDSFIGRHASIAMKIVRAASVHLQPIINERRAMMEELGDAWTDRPVRTRLTSSPMNPFHRNCVQKDMLQWILEQATARRTTDDEVVRRIMIINFAALHTSSTVRVPLIRRTQLASKACARNRARRTHSTILRPIPSWFEFYARRSNHS